MQGRSKGVVIGGIISGILAVIPIVNWGNCCLCMWVYLCAALAAAIHVKASDEPVTSGQGTVTGLMTIIPTIAIFLLIGLPMTLLTTPVMMGLLVPNISDPVVQEQLAQQAGSGMVSQILNHVISTLVFAVVGAGMAALGGLTGVAIFENRGDGPPVVANTAPVGPQQPYQPPQQQQPPYNPPPQQGPY